MTELIDRDLLFGNPDRALVRVSPNGAWLSFVAPLEGVLNVWVAPVDEPTQAKPITNDRERGIREYEWAASSERILVLQDRQGDENWRVAAVDPSSGESLDLTPLEGVQARIVGLSRRHPHSVVVGLNNRNPQLHDLHRIDVRTGERTLVLENPGLVGLMVDRDLAPAIGAQPTPDGGNRVMRYHAGTWSEIMVIGQEDALTTGPLLLTEDGSFWYWIDSRDRDTAALVREDLKTGAFEVLAEDPRADIADATADPRTFEIQVAYSVYGVRQPHVLDERIQVHLDRLEAHRSGPVEIISRSQDDAVWVVAWEREDGPVAYGLYRPETGAVSELFLSRTALEDLTLAGRRPEVLTSRDSLPLVSYLSLPPWLDRGGRPRQPLPMVLLVHGGPWARDQPGYDPYHQFLANRGYAVLSVNFRGSTGFGKRFIEAGNHEWAGAMHDDLLDAVEWAVSEGVADRDRIAIMGGSYGGYATLVGLTFTPEVFACGVDIVGPSNLQTLIESVPPYWAPIKAQFTTRVGDDATEEGRAFLWSRSPLSKVDRIVRPLLIAQGANDPRVKQAESDQIVAAMRERGIPVTYALFPDEGHGFARPENRIAFMALLEQFLAKYLGGRAQDEGSVRERSSMEIV